MRKLILTAAVVLAFSGYGFSKTVDEDYEEDEVEAVAEDSDDESVETAGEKSEVAVAEDDEEDNQPKKTKKKKKSKKKSKKKKSSFYEEDENMDFEQLNGFHYGGGFGLGYASYKRYRYTYSGAQLDVGGVVQYRFNDQLSLISGIGVDYHSFSQSQNEYGYDYNEYSYVGLKIPVLVRFNFQKLLHLGLLMGIWTEAGLDVTMSFSTSKEYDWRFELGYVERSTSVRSVVQGFVWDIVGVTIPVKSLYVDVFVRMAYENNLADAKEDYVPENFFGISLGAAVLF